jgi:hypothetical protein
MHLLLSVLAILIGALLTAGGLQELVLQGILNSRLYPLVGGALGTVAGVFLLFSGIALFRKSELTERLVRATALVSLPVFVLIGFIRPLAGWPVTIAGLLFPLILMAYVGARPLSTR